MRRFAPVAAAFLLVPLALSGCKVPAEEPGGKYVAATGATVRTNPNADAPWAAYFTLTGGAEDRVVTGVSVEGAERAELHESRKDGGLMTMVPLARIPVPAHGHVIFRQGGKHVMLFGVTSAARAAGRMTLTLSLDDGSNVIVELAFPPEAAANAANAAPAASAAAAPTPAPAAAPATTPAAVAPPPAPADDHGGHDEHSGH